MEFIRKNEIRINQQNEKAIINLGQITQQKKKLATELRQLIGTVRDLDYDNKEIQSQISSVTNICEEKMQDLNGRGQVNKVKSGL